MLSGLVFILLLVCIGLVLWSSLLVRRIKSQSAASTHSARSATDTLSERIHHLLAAAVESNHDQSKILDPRVHIAFGHKPFPGLEVSLTQLSDAPPLRTLPLPNNVKGYVSDFVLEAAQLYGEATGIKTLAIRFSPLVRSQLSNGQLELMKSTLGNKPIAIDPNNFHRTVGIGDLTSRVNPAVAVAFAWQVLAFITAQEFLVDISKRLTAIGQGVDEIRQFLIDEQESEIIANYEYLQQVTTSVLQRGVSPEEVIVIGVQLEDIERQSSRTFQLATKTGRRLLAELREKHQPAYLEKQFEQRVKYAADQVDHFVAYSRVCLLSLTVRSAAVYLRAALPLSKSVANNRLSRVRHDLESYRVFQSEFERKILALNETIRSVWFRENKTPAPVETVWYQWLRRLGLDSSASIQEANTRVKSMFSQLEQKCDEINEMVQSVEKATTTHEQDSTVVYGRVEGTDVTLLIPCETGE